MDEPKELGTLIVVVGKARNLVNKSRFGKQDPFCTVTYAEDKQKTKAIKRGGQHPEWDEELRFTIFEDVDDVLARTQSLKEGSTTPTSLTASTPKVDASPGVTTAQALATRSRKGPINKKGAKSLRLACYADDAKEPELIGECAVPIDEVLRKGEVDEWYDISYKEKYSGEVYLELTFYSNDAPPVKRNVPRPPINNYGGAGIFESGQSSLNPSNRLSGGISASGSVSGMSLYIPPYVKPNDINSTMPLNASSSFQNLGVPPVRQQTPLPGQPSLPPQSFESLSVDLLTAPMSNMSLTSGAPSGRPLPSTTPMPLPQLGHNLHRHSVGGPAEAPWGSLLPQSQPAPPPAPHPRPMSTSDVPWDHAQRIQDERRTGGNTPLPRPVSGQAQRIPWQAQPDPYSSPVPMPGGFPGTLQPPTTPQPPIKPHANSFSGVSSQPDSATGVYSHPRPDPIPHANSAPVAPTISSYHTPTSSFGDFASNGQEPLPQPPTHPGYGQGPDHTGAYQQTPPHGGYAQTPPQNGYQHHQQYDTPSRHDSYNHRNSLPEPVLQQTQSYAVPANTSYPPSQGYHQPAQSSHHQENQQPLAPNLSSQASVSTSSTGYVPWYQQTQSTAPTQPPYQPLQTPQSDPYRSPTYGSQPPAVPSRRPIPNPPAPPKNPEGYYYPSDELYRNGPSPQPQQPTPPRTVPWQSAPAPSSYIPPTSTSYEPQYQSQVSAYGGSSTPVPYANHNDGYNNNKPPAEAPERPSSAWQSSVPPNHQQPQAPLRAPSPAPPMASYVRSPSPAPIAQNWGRSPSPAPPPQAYPRAPSPVPPQPYPRAPSPAPPQPYARAPSPAPPIQSSYHTAPPTQPYRAPSPQPYASQSPHQGYMTANQDPNSPHSSNGYSNTVSPSPVSARTNRPDWRSYLQNLSVGQSPIRNGQSAPGRDTSPSPAPPPKDWYTPPPSLPSSIRPPDGWKSTLSSDPSSQWRG